MSICCCLGIFDGLNISHLTYQAELDGQGPRARKTDIERDALLAVIIKNYAANIHFGSLLAAGDLSQDKWTQAELERQGYANVHKDANDVQSNGQDHRGTREG
jgi:hypothetical protein